MAQDRLDWVDAMRGFSMVVVVLGHVLLYMGIGGHDTVLGSILLTFRMPLFFFVSGYFSYRAINWWSKIRIAHILKRKFQAQIICTVVFGFVYQVVIGGGGGNLFIHSFEIYWFTTVLFQMYLLYLLCELISYLINQNITIPLLVIITLVGVLSLVVVNKSDSEIYRVLSWHNLLQYFQYFTVGIICSRYKELFFRMLCNNRFYTFMIIGWIGGEVFCYSKGMNYCNSYLKDFIQDILLRYFALFSVISIFFGKSKEIKMSQWGKQFRIIGRRTLDIYMIHMFLLPNLEFMKSWLIKGNMFVIQCVISGTIAMIVVYLCLLISFIIRKSPLLESWLFGVRK